MHHNIIRTNMKGKIPEELISVKSFDGKENLNGDSANGVSETRYTTFSESYKIISFAMGIGMIYPNPRTATLRLICILVMVLMVTPISIVVLIDIYNSWLQRDFIDIVRHGTVIGPLLGIFLKILILFYKRNLAKEIIDEIDNDYAMYNHLPASYQTIVDSHLHNSLLYSEKCWSITVVCIVAMFPGVAVVLNIYNYLFKDEPTKYMIHDLNKPYASPEDRFESPFFEVMFVYMCFCSMFYIINFTGFDGFFGLAVNHASLKMELYCKAFEDAMRATNKMEIQSKVVEVIVKQNRMYKFVDLIQETFNLWLGLILVITVIEICNSTYHVTEGAESDPRYIVFILGTVVQIYLPCRYSSKLKHMAAETATMLYCGGWENVCDVSTRRTVLMMLARGQMPLDITAFNLLIYDMELFVSLLKASYSMYTLLRS